jgi:4-amino-4-deoxy-L-arabinose transferase-like glycosyltransferase
MVDLRDPKQARRIELFALIAIILLAIGFRAYHLNYDLPFLYDQDEPMFVEHTLTMLKNHDPNPHWFGPPASTTMYLLALVYACVFAVGRVFGVFHSVEDFRNLYYSNPTVFYLSGRIVSLLFGVATVPLLYKIGKRMFGTAAGLLAAAVLALSPPHIALSQQVRMDVQMVFLLVAAYWYCLNILEQHDWKSYLLAGFLTGLAAVTKYPAAVFVLVLAFSHFAAHPTFNLRDHKKLVGCAIATIAGVFVGSPFLLLDFATVLRDVAQEARPEHLGATGEGLLRNLVWYLKGPTPEALSAAGLVLATIGTVCCLLSKERARLLLVVFPIVFLIFISSLHLRWNRWFLPEVPFLALLLAYGAIKFRSWYADRLGARGATAITTVVVAAVLIPLFIRSASYAREIATPFSSTVAGQWLTERVPRNSRVLVEVYGPQLPLGLFDVFVVDDRGNVVPAKNVATNVMPSWDIGRLSDPKQLAAQNIEYVVVSDESRFYAESEKYAKEVSNYERAIAGGQLVFEINPAADGRRGPRVRIFKLRGAPAGSTAALTP